MWVTSWQYQLFYFLLFNSLTENVLKPLETCLLISKNFFNFRTKHNFVPKKEWICIVSISLLKCILCPVIPSTSNLPSFCSIILYLYSFLPAAFMSFRSLKAGRKENKWSTNLPSLWNSFKKEDRKETKEGNVRWHENNKLSGFNTFFRG